MVRSMEEIYSMLKEGLKSNNPLYFEFEGKLLAVFLPREKLEELGLVVADDYEPLELNR